MIDFIKVDLPAAFGPVTIMFDPVISKEFLTGLLMNRWKPPTTFNEIVSDPI
jgi:hypothetical protein